MPPWFDVAWIGAATAIAWIVIAAGLLQTLVYLAQLVLAAGAMLHRPPSGRFNLLWRRYSELAPPISLLVPAYNEGLNIVESVKALLSMEYPNYEVIVINDGSKDRTLDILIQAFELRPTERLYDSAVPHKPIRGLYASPRHPRLLVIDKENGGKADAQNAGIDLARAPLFCVIDGDSLLDPDALLRAVRPFVDDPVRTIGAGGTIRIANGCDITGGRVVQVRLPRKALALFQVIEYLRAFLMARIAWSRIDSLMLISGAFGVFRRKEAVEVGGFSLGTVGEDLDFVIKLHRHMRDTGQDYRLAFVPEAVCWTEAPETLTVLGRQRARWQRGALECFFKYRGMLFRPRYGRISFLGLGHILLVDVVGPVVEVIGYLLVPAMWALGLLEWDFMLAFLALTFTYGVFISVGALILEELRLRRFPKAHHLAVLMLIAVAENFGYRQINNAWRLRGWWQFLRKEQGWGQMTRAGFRSR
jgi:cellulose synthase/poly-beta-1,6-N-acetylglucosamine synthase-like glycosyltransferase